MDSVNSPGTGRQDGVWLEIGLAHPFSHSAKTQEHRKTIPDDPFVVLGADFEFTQQFVRGRVRLKVPGIPRALSGNIILIRERLSTGNDVKLILTSLGHCANIAGAT